MTAKHGTHKIRVWWQDKTLWTNIVAILAVVLNNKYGYHLSTEAQTMIIGLINVFLKLPQMAPTRTSAARRNEVVRQAILSSGQVK